MNWLSCLIFWEQFYYLIQRCKSKNLIAEFWSIFHLSFVLKFCIHFRFFAFSFPDACTLIWSECTYAQALYTCVPVYIVRVYTLCACIHCARVYIVRMYTLCACIYTVSNTLWTIFLSAIFLQLKHFLLLWNRMTLNSSRSWRARTVPRLSTRKTPMELRSRMKMRKTSMRKILERKKRERVKRTSMMRARKEKV